MGRSNKSKREYSKTSTDKHVEEEQGEVVGSTSNSPSIGHNLTRNVTGSPPNPPPNPGASTTARRPGTLSPSAGTTRAQLPMETDRVPVRTRRYPQCSRCRSHGVLSPIKGHKKFCKWKDCKCHNCQLITARQKLMAKVIALHRQQDMEAMVTLQQVDLPAAESHSMGGDEVPDFGVKMMGPNISSTPIPSSLQQGHFMTDSHGNPQASSLQVVPHSSIQYQWNSNTSSHSSPEIGNEIPIQVPQSSETDIQSPIYGTSLASHGNGGRSGNLAPMVAYTPYSNCSHQQLPFPFGLVSTPKLSTATSQIYSPNFLVYHQQQHQQQQQQQQQLQVQMPQYRIQSSSFGGCVGDVQSAFVPVGQQNPASHHTALAQADSPSPSELTSADHLDEVGVLEVEASGIQAASKASASHTLRIPVPSRTMQQAFLPACTNDMSTMSDLHSLPTAGPSYTQPRAFIPLQNALFPQKHTQDGNKN